MPNLEFLILSKFCLKSDRVNAKEATRSKQKNDEGTKTKPRRSTLLRRSDVEKRRDPVMIKTDREESRDLNESSPAPDPSLMSKANDIADNDDEESPPRRTPKDSNTRPKGRKRRRSDGDTGSSRN